MQRTLKSLLSQVTEVDLVYRNKRKAAERPPVSNCNDAYSLFVESWDMDKIELQEQFRVMLLDRKNSCLGISTVATGGMTSCVVDLKIVFAMSLKAKATSIILAHNHPSGNRSPSNADKTITAKFIEAGKLLELPVLDHLIVTKEGFTSLAEEGLL